MRVGFAETDLASCTYRILLPDQARMAGGYFSEIKFDLFRLAYLRDYLRLGAYLSGEPAWDEDFNTADLFIMFAGIAHECAFRQAIFAPGQLAV
jgi:putative hemolysin